MNDPISKKHTDPIEDFSYSTGATQPPKSHRGLIAFLLAAVIFLCGLSTALGVMNIRLFQALNDPALLSVSPESDGTTAPARNDLQQALGFEGAEVSDFWNLYQDLPRGVYVTSVSDYSEAARKGVRPGDILIGLEDQPVTGPEELNQLLSRQTPGQRVKLVFYRDGALRSLTVQIGR